ncbi:MAG: hypothetical protein M0C28_02380 [Candidatus Moduliflexus flocculans]|nr:hypothetical protein [Candidatus Moduliflexus flocculans]
MKAGGVVVPDPERGRDHVLSHPPPAPGRRRPHAGPLRPPGVRAPGPVLVHPGVPRHTTGRPRRVRYQLLRLPGIRRGLRQVLRPARGRVRRRAAAEERDPDALLPDPERERPDRRHDHAGLALPDLPADVVAREDLRLVLLLLLARGGTRGPGLLLVVARFPPRPGRPLRGRGAAVLVGLRLVALPLGQLERIQAIRLFDPAVAGFVSWQRTDRVAGRHLPDGPDRPRTGRVSGRLFVGPAEGRRTDAPVRSRP